MSLQDRLEFADVVFSDLVYILPKTVYRYHFMEIASSQKHVVKKMV